MIEKGFGLELILFKHWKKGKEVKEKDLKLACRCSCHFSLSLFE